MHAKKGTTVCLDFDKCSCTIFAGLVVVGTNYLIIPSMASLASQSCSDEHSIGLKPCSQ